MFWVLKKILTTPNAIETYSGIDNSDKLECHVKKSVHQNPIIYSSEVRCVPKLKLR